MVKQVQNHFGIPPAQRYLLARLVTINNLRTEGMQPLITKPALLDWGYQQIQGVAHETAYQIMFLLPQTHRLRTHYPEARVVFMAKLIPSDPKDLERASNYQFAAADAPAFLINDTMREHMTTLAAKILTTQGHTTVLVIEKLNKFLPGADRMIANTNVVVPRTFNWTRTGAVGGKRRREEVEDVEEATYAPRKRGRHDEDGQEYQPRFPPIQAPQEIRRGVTSTELWNIEYDKRQKRQKEKAARSKERRTAKLGLVKGKNKRSHLPKDWSTYGTVNAMGRFNGPN